MNQFGRHQTSRGFTLVELLTVITILGILAAMLLPALSQAKARAHRATCISQLRELGLAFHLFANDHQGRLPMRVPMSEGGSADFVQAAGQVDGDFYFAYRHFQVLSNELVTPQILICPTDQRRPTNNFAKLQNENLSYFVNVAAEHGKTTSILAGDRNLTNDWANVGSNFRLDANSMLRWTSELHRYRGNLLFGDTHVEERNKSALLISPSDPIAASLHLPTPAPAAGRGRAAKSPKRPDPAETTDTALPAGPGGNTATPGPGATVTLGDPPNRVMAHNVGKTSHAVETSTSSSAKSPEKSAVTTTNLPSRPARPAAVTAATGQSMFDTQLVEFLQSLVGWTYLLLLLLLLLYLAIRSWLWLRERRARAADEPAAPNIAPR